MPADNARQLAISRNYLTVADVEAIQALVRSIEGGVRVIDLGAGSGTTALSVLDERPDAQIVTIDISAENLSWAEKAVRNVYPSANWRGILSRADEVRDFFDGQPVNLILHDAGHEYADVYGDLVEWASAVPAGCLVWVHDYARAPWEGADAYPGVAEAIQVLTVAEVLRETGTPGIGWTGIVQ